MTQHVLPEVIALIPAELAHQYRVAPLALDGSTLELAVGESDVSMLRDISFLTGKKVRPVLMDRHTLDELLRRLYPGKPAGENAAQRDVPSGRAHVKAKSKGAESWNALPIIHRVDQIIRDAIEARASDIHIEPYESALRVRYRLDGVLHTQAEFSTHQREELIARLKIMAGLDIAEKRRPQDGRIRTGSGGSVIDIRVSTLPTEFGEKVVLRILDKSGVALDLEALGFDERSLTAFRRAIRLPYGMVLVTGPTGSGKTTTLYAALSAINTPEINVTTIEDPVEYNLPGINQAHVRSDIGFTFSQALRAFLRQDPNVIMVGEIRDAETAEIAVRAALTGHLVLSTLHTNDAPSTVTRLLDMGIEPFLVASSVRLVIAQRLVRRICSHCKIEAQSDPAILAELQLDTAVTPVHKGAGCPDCNGTGYRGRTAIFEAMPVSEAVSELIATRASTHAVRLQARKEGMVTLREAAAQRIRMGITTADEVLRETAL